MHYDFLKIANIFQFASVHYFFTKMWAITQGKLLGTLEWKQVVSENSWVWLDGSQQVSDWECGFYVLKFMTKYVDYMYQDNAPNIKVQLPLANPQKFFVVIEYKTIYILYLVFVCWLQVTPTWFSRDDVIAIRLILVNAIL